MRVLLDTNVLQAIDSEIGDFEDAIQFFLAVHCSAASIITRNVADYPSSGIPVTTPEEFLARIIHQNPTVIP